ncbi:5'/3'-nucleotidase SurE [Rhodococcus sp. SGAir0479]|uniref:5'/3'-nucleotidase SurE n=1 Tax=Rhodococcus sp. SGAir0479 TaxID=2567884 RepID=UPI0010CD507C|nr:5'/3'-nucleotidase SurE [Rhodococcus sp. SGAir0479]QCQ91633.1 5'/3'-nucleotidase SurE [Rhodococcus sp. SGAir0479]
MRALIVNDDGIDSPGLAVLARVAVAAGLEVQVAAPHVERSGASASLSALEDDGKLMLSRRTMPDLPGVEVLAVEASPAMIAFVAAHGAFGPAPDLVLSGINLGPNTGHAILHSGTVGAVLTAAAHGARGVALSLDQPSPSDWETAEAVASHAVRWAVEHAAPGRVLNVNIPDVPIDGLLGLRAAPLAEFGAVQAEIGDVEENGDESRAVTVTFRKVEIDSSGDSDAVLLHDGWATATVLRMPFEVAEADLGDLTFSRSGNAVS